MMKPRLRGAIWFCVCILSLAASQTVNASTISVTSGAAGTVRDHLTNGLSVISKVSLQMVNDGDGLPMDNFQFEDRGVAEFGLSGLGVDSVSSALLNLFDFTTNAPSSELPVTIDIYGYTGNGSIGVSDFSPAGETFLTSVSFDGQAPFSVDVTGFINDQLTIPSIFAGFNLRLPSPSADARVFGFDGSDGNNPPVLTLTTVPIPAAVWLFGTGLVGLVGIARRKRCRS